MTAGVPASSNVWDANIPAEVLGDNQMFQPDLPNGSYCSASFQTDLTSDQIAIMQDQSNKLVAEKVTLQKKLDEKILNENFFKDNDDNVKFYTRLNLFTDLMIVFHCISSHISVTSQSSLTTFQQMLLTLMKLRHDYAFKDLANRFGFSPATCSRVFQKVLHVLYTQLGGLVKWPTREELRRTMPVCFMEHFGNNVTVILDCFEVSIDRPTSLLAQAKTWSSYRHHNTVKFLMGVAPQGRFIHI